MGCMQSSDLTENDIILVQQAVNEIWASIDTSAVTLREALDQYESRHWVKNLRLFITSRYTA